jgi:hypothetical protein
MKLTLKLMNITDFRLLVWFTVDATFGSLHRADVGSVANISELRAASIFWVEYS